MKYKQKKSVEGKVGISVSCELILAIHYLKTQCVYLHGSF